MADIAVSPGLTPELIRSYNATRQTRDTSLLCYYPWSTLNFDQTGRVTACCYNRAHVLGRYPEESIESIWFGERAEELRAHLQNHDLTHGCGECLRQIASGNFHGTLARRADEFAEPGLARRWAPVGRDARSNTAFLPKVFEFEISSTCNLECVMCSGYFSSAIRSRREKLPVLDSPYDHAFVDQLVPFLPHLRAAKFLGGEPFLIQGYYHIWERVLRHHPALDISITTNATVLKPRTKEMLQRLRCTLVVSLDSLVRERYERIRVNACFDDVMQNVRYLRSLVRGKGTSLTFAVCPMTLNWHEIPDMVRYCNAHGDLIHFNTLTFPVELSLQSLLPHELARICVYLGRTELPLRTQVERRNSAAYHGLLNQITRWRDERNETRS